MISAAIDVGPAALAAVIFTLLAVWCFTNRRIDHTLAALGLYLGLLDGYIKLRTGSPAATLGRDVLVAAIAGGALLRALSTGKRLPLPPLGGLVLAFSAIVIVELFNPEGPGLVAGMGGIRQHLEFVPLFFLGYAVMRRESQVQTFLVILALCAAAGGLISYVQSTLTPEQLANWGPGYSERILGTGPFEGAPRVAYDDDGGTSVRPFGLGSDLGAGAVAAALALPALIALIALAPPSRRAVLAPLAIGIGLAVATSGTRAALVMVFISTMAFAILSASSRNAMRVVLGLLFASMIVYGAFQYLGPDNSTARRAKSITPDKALTTFTQERGGSVQKFGEYAEDYPLGLGVGSVGPAASRLSGRPIGTQALNTETQWNFLVLEVGIAGFLLFVALNLALMVLALTRIRRVADARMRLRLAALAAPLFGLLAAGFAGPTSATVPPAPYMWFVAGVLSYWLVTAARGQAGSGHPPRGERSDRARTALPAAAAGRSGARSSLPGPRMPA